MEYSIKHYLEIEKEHWDNFIFSNSMGWAYFLHDVIPIHRYATYINESFAILNDTNEILMIVQLHRTPSFELISQWGFVLKDNLSKKQFKKIRECFCNHINCLIKKYNITQYNIAFPPLSDANIPQKHNMLNPALFFYFKPNIDYTYIIDLSKPDDKMLADCEETTRQAIRKHSSSNRYTVVESNGSKEDCQSFISLHKETYTRTHSERAIISDEYHVHIFEKLVPQNRAKVYFLKDNETNKYIAGVIILLYKNTAYYWWGASVNDKDIGINKYLLFQSICKVRKLFGNTGYFETGYACPYIKKGKAKGISDYKKCFGTFLHPIFKGRYYLNISPKVHKILGIKLPFKRKICAYIEENI